MNYKEILGLVATMLAIISYLPYLQDISTNKTNPHGVTWLIWGVLNTIAFFGQIVENSGAGAWVTGITALTCLYISFIGFKKKRAKMSSIDRISLLGALVSLVVWGIMKNPFMTIILLTSISFLGYIPTFVKSYKNPFDETLRTYLLGGLKFVPALFALNAFTFVNIIIPLSALIFSWLFTIIIFTRRVYIYNNEIVAKRNYLYLKDYINTPY
ncbi:MAG: hypothetical protein ACREHC_06795 [Candidatus Levyibacteriota bacterium]